MNEGQKQTIFVNFKVMQGVQKVMEFLNNVNGQINVDRCKDKNERSRIGYILLKNMVKEMTDILSTAL